MRKWLFRLMGFGCILDDVKEENNKKSKYESINIVPDNMLKKTW